MYVMFRDEWYILEPVSSLHYPRGVNVLVRYTASLVPDQPLGEISLSRLNNHVFSAGLQFYDFVHIHELIILGARFMDLVDHSKLYRITDLKAT